MNSVMTDFALDSGWASEVREFGEEAVDRCAVADGLYARDPCAACLGWGRQRRDSVQQAVLAVYQETEMGQEVHADDGMDDVGHHERPREIPTYTEVEAARQPTVCVDGSAVAAQKS
jgi:hypothetical protein